VKIYDSSTASSNNQLSCKARATCLYDSSPSYIPDSKYQ